MILILILLAEYLVLHEDPINIRKRDRQGGRQMANRRQYSCSLILYHEASQYLPIQPCKQLSYINLL